MKRLITAILFLFGFIGSANATDFDLNPNLIAITAVRAVVHEVLGGSSSLKIGTYSHSIVPGGFDVTS
jgi:hypothetical protein